jgi:hypothetical protein
MQKARNLVPWRWLVALIFIATAAQAISANASTKLFGVIYDGAIAKEELATINPATADAALIGTGIADCCNVSSSSTLDAGSGVMYFIGTKFSETTPRLFALDTSAGTILSSPAIPTSFYLDFIEYDSSTGRLLGFIYDIASETEKLATINPATAAATPIGAGISQCCNVTTAPALNSAGSVIYLMGTELAESTPRLFGFNTQTGAVVSNPTISSSIYMDFIEYDSSTSRLLGFVYDDVTQIEKLVSINPSTAVATPIGTGISQCCNVSTGPALDRTAGIIYLPGSNFAETAPRLFGFNIQTGAVVSNPTISSSIYLDFLEAGYGAVPFSDFDGNGKPDILWRNAATGDNYVWYMDGLTVLGGGNLPMVADQNWKVVGIADFNNDSKPDILWRNAATGDNYVWYMNGVTVQGGGNLPTVADQSWKVVGARDFNNDGKPDILWRNAATGDNYVWYMNGVTVQGGGNLPMVADQNWKIVGVADFNNNSKPDILWRNAATGENYVWYLDGVTVQGGGNLPTVADQSWKIAGVADFNNNDKPDILWRNAATGENYIWYLDGLTVLGGGSLPTVADQNWTIVP